MKKIIISIIALLAIVYFGCSNPEKTSQQQKQPSAPFDILQLSKEDARQLADSSLANLAKEYPYRLGSLGTAADLKSPKAARPAFYGCGDWSTAVMTTTGLVRLLKLYPDLDSTRTIHNWLLERISAKNIQGEIAYFENPFNRNSQRGSGWDNVLKLTMELKDWNDPIAAKLQENLLPLAQMIESRYRAYLPKLMYAFKGSTANNFSTLWLYATTFKKDSLKIIVEQKAKDFFLKDKDYKLAKESSKSTRVSTGLEEINIMCLILPKQEFKDWLTKYCPEITNSDFTMVPAVKDKAPKTEDEKAEELNTGRSVEQPEQLNLNRAKRLIALATAYPEYDHLKVVGYEHVITALPKIVVEKDLKLRLFHMFL